MASSKQKLWLVCQPMFVEFAAVAYRNLKKKETDVIISAQQHGCV